MQIYSIVIYMFICVLNRTKLQLKFKQKNRCLKKSRNEHQKPFEIVKKMRFMFV